MRKVILLFLLLTLDQEKVTAQQNNVLLFTVDSCRPDRFSLYGNPRKTTPHIDAWARIGVIFDNAFSVSAWTAPGLVSILTGLYPWEHGVDSRDRMADPAVPSLLKMFRQAGYAVPNLNFFTFAPYYQNLGLGEIDREYFTQKEGDELINWLDKHSDKPFFVWYHTTTIHQPYKRGEAVGDAKESEGIKAVKTGAIVPKGSVKFADQDQQMLLDLYDAEIENMDRFFGAVLAKLKEKGVLEDTLVVLTADHGEELLEHGFVGHASTSLEAKLYDEIIRIPLIVSAPWRLRPGRRSELIQQMDLFPMILSLAGLKKQTTKTQRHKVFVESVIAGNQTTREREHIWLRAVRTKTAKHIQRWENGKVVAEEFYDLTRDPAEKNPGKGTLKFPTDSPGSKTPRYATTNPGKKASQPCPLIHKPFPSQTLEYAVHTGAILFEWEGERDQDYVVEYDIGTGDHRVAGKYPVKGNYQILGPFPPELWQSLKAWKPFKIRISPAASECWSEWREFYF